MDNETLIKIGLAVFTFVLGLISKLLYDLWQQRKTKKTLLLTKGIASSFLRKISKKIFGPTLKFRTKGIQSTVSALRALRSRTVVRPHCETKLAR